MSMHQWGLVSLNLSMAIYFIWFIPQLRLTFRRHDVEGLSIWMHTLLYIGYGFDLIYGFGRDMPLQYRLVTMTGIGYLFIQHYQFFRFGHRDDRVSFLLSSLLITIVMCMAVYMLFVQKQSIVVYDNLGMIANLCWFSFVIPQIVENIRRRSSQAVSLGFLWLALLTSALDLFSAYTLHWDWPSKVGGEMGFVLRLILLLQCHPKSASVFRNVIRRGERDVTS